MHLIPNPLIIPVGAVVGVLIAAPVGPVNVLCVQRAIERGFWGGVAAGLGAVLGDGLVALFAAMSVGTLSGAITYYRSVIQVVGGLALMAFGARLYLTEPRITPDVHINGRPPRLKDFAWDIPKTFFLTITNPAAVLGLIAIFGGVGTFVDVRRYVDALTLVAAIVGGSLAWWIVLSHFVGRIRHRLTMSRLAEINRIAGVLLLVFGVTLVGEIALKIAGLLR
jgi:threonine/homoserine/homoserine lactone efflux protein